MKSYAKDIEIKIWEKMQVVQDLFFKPKILNMQLISFKMYFKMNFEIRRVHLLNRILKNLQKDCSLNIHLRCQPLKFRTH